MKTAQNKTGKGLREWSVEMACVSFQGIGSGPIATCITNH